MILTGSEISKMRAEGKVTIEPYLYKLGSCRTWLSASFVL